ncbi:C1 family peptidase [Adlercreutzia equolifaciens]|uniref:aminopeptidase C n=1 Tax=Adlercreutzia equolifaciens TaxID=446660 RepID=UPI0023B088E7|nr:C1 family peptidase [Adlercreutzia equolifaciens]MDE8701738.1 C1 family peptidase [Adlercreutzia equolifaciens]
MKISKEQIEKMHESFKKCETQQVAQKAVTVNGILKSAENVEVLKRLSPANFAFSIDVDKEAVANQLMSGRCWMFACLNTLRFRIEKELDLPHGTFELSQAYLAFYNKLERAAWFMKHIVETADKDLNDREVTWLIQSPMQDGGDWDMVAALVKKYGVVPHSAMSETHCTNNTSEVNTVLSHLLRQDALKLRSMAREGKDTEAVQEEMLNEVYRILAVCFGEPVQKFDFQYEDKKGNYHADYDLTPLEFYKKYVGMDLDDYIGVINVPGDENPYGRTYTIEDSDQIPERENLYLNVEMDDLKQMVIAQLKAGEPVWFGCDVLQHCDRYKGVMDMDLYDLEAMFGIKFNMTKAERYAMRESLPTHAMVIAGVDLDKDGKPTKWKIENSWGTENGGKKTGNNGYFVCGDEWFDNFVYEVAINKKFMTAEQQKALTGEPIVWPFWATFNPVSA